MKISTEQLRAIQEQEARRAKKQQTAQPDDFSGLLTRQIESDNVTPGAANLERTPAQTSPVPLVSGAMENVHAGMPDSLFGEAANSVEGMFGTLESYASRLAEGESGNLKEAHALLQSIGGQVDAFRERFSDVSAASPEIAALVNELDVLTTTETFKFNRGDYI